MQHTSGLSQTPHTGSIHQKPRQWLLAPAAVSLVCDHVQEALSSSELNSGEAQNRNVMIWFTSLWAEALAFPLQTAAWPGCAGKSKCRVRVRASAQSHLIRLFMVVPARQAMNLPELSEGFPLLSVLYLSVGIDSQNSFLSRFISST